MKRNVLLKTTVLFFIIAAVYQPAFAHTYRVPMIVDTDVGMDDLRALVMLNNSGMADILLAVTSDGSASPAAGKRNVETLFSLMGQTVRAAAGRSLDAPPPPWRPWTEQLLAFHKDGPPPVKVGSPSTAIVTTLKNAEGPCIYLCLGPLTNLADALKAEPAIKDKISRVVYFGTTPGDKADWNTKRDMEAAQRVFASSLKIVVLDNPGNRHLPFDTAFFQKIKAMDTPASRLFIKLHNHPAAKKRITGGHFRIWDELAVLYLNDPGLFRYQDKGEGVSVISGYDAQSIYAGYLLMLGHGADLHLRKRDTVILKTFPLEPGEFKTDLSPSVTKIIERYGLEEWKACVLTNELHRHLGLYSIIGAKMGIRARELLDAPADSVQVVSFAGLEPPLSCLNDGLQVSTGASLGRGSITVETTKPGPSATFTYKGETVTLKLKGAVVQRIKTAIREAIEKYGTLTPEYFQQVRQLSIRSWYELDRGEIFDLIHQEKGAKGKN